MLHETTNKRLRGTFGTHVYMVGPRPQTMHASPQIITHATADRWKALKRVPKNRVVVTG